MKSIFDDAGLQLPRGRVPGRLLRRPRRAGARGVRPPAPAAVRDRGGVRRPPHQGRQHPRHAVRARPADRGVRRAVRRRGQQHRRHGRLRVHAVRRQRQHARRRADAGQRRRAARTARLAIDTWHMSKLGIAPEELRRIPRAVPGLGRALRRAVRRTWRTASTRRSTTAGCPGEGEFDIPGYVRGLPARPATPGRGESRCCRRRCASCRSSRSSSERTKRPSPSSAPASRREEQQ